jgi:hydroxymethylpyrimidine pyrophosphatase-like HAD family hydrolase
MAGVGIGDDKSPLRSAGMTPPTTSRRYDVVFCDIDGCLAPESTGPMDVPSLAVIAEHNRLAQERRDRPVVTLCSGRPQPFAEAMGKIIGNTSIPLVAENGVWVYDPASNDYLMDPAITREHRAAIRDASAWLESEFGPQGVSQQPGKSASISLYHADTDYLKSIGPRVREEFAARAWPLRVSMTWLYINCDLTHVSKGTGLDRVLTMLGGLPARLGRPVERARLAGIGDTPSDLAIRERVAWFGCPGNADAQLKPRADVVATGHEAAGVVELLDSLVG